MPAPMPPQGAPPSPQGDDQSQGQGADQGAGGGSITSLLMNVDKAIDHINMVVQQSKATNPEEKKMFGMIDQLFGQFMQSIGQGGEPDADDAQQGPGAQGQTVPAEAAGNKGAVPSPY